MDWSPLLHLILMTPTSLQHLTSSLKMSTFRHRKPHLFIMVYCYASFPSLGCKIQRIGKEPKGWSVIASLTLVSSEPRPQNEAPQVLITACVSMQRGTPLMMPAGRIASTAFS